MLFSAYFHLFVISYLSIHTRKVIFPLYSHFNNQKKASTISLFTLYSTCENSYFLMHQYNVHCDPFTILFTTRLLYRFTLKSISFNSLSYHSMVDSMHLYSALSKSMYSTFLPFSYLTCYFNYGLTSHIMLTTSPSNFNNDVFALII